MSEKQECANQGLLPCPFCGGGCLEIVEIEIPFMENKEWFSVRCLNCKFECDTQKDDIIAKRKWNARPTEEALQAKLDKAVEALEYIKRIDMYGADIHATDKMLVKMAVHKAKQALKEIGE